MSDPSAYTLRRLEELQKKLNEANERYFGLEGRMNTFEEVSKLEAGTRKQMLMDILENQKDARNKIRILELKVATAAGAILVGEFLLKLVWK